MLHITRRNIALTLLIISSSSSFAHSYVKPLAIIAGAGLAGYFVGPSIYSYFFPLTDREELEQSINKINKAEVLHNDILAIHRNEIAVMNEYGSNDSAKINNAQIIEKLTLNIMAKYSKYPYYNYIKGLNVHNQKIKDSINELSSNRIVLTERMLKLSNNKNITPSEFSILHEEYKTTIATMNNTINNLDALHKQLLLIHSIVTQSTQYILEYQHLRIEELEHRVDTYQSYSYPNDYSSWSRPADTVYITTQTESCSTPSETVYVSTAASQVTVNNYNTVSSSYNDNSSSNSQSEDKTNHVSSDSTSTNYERPTMEFDPEVWCDRTDPFNS